MKDCIQLRPPEDHDYGKKKREHVPYDGDGVGRLRLCICGHVLSTEANPYLGIKVDTHCRKCGEECPA